MAPSTTSAISEQAAIPFQGLEQVIHNHNAIYNRFSAPTKRFIVFLVSMSGVIPFFLSGTFIPSVPKIAKDLNSTTSVITLGVSISMLTSSIGSFVWATYSTFYGRRPIYLTGIPLLIIGSCGVGQAQTVAALMCWRVVQAFGASGGHLVGAGVIADLYRLEERGTVMGAFFSAGLLGLVLAPPAGGFAVHYASWRALQYIIGAWGLAILLLMTWYLPETSHPGSRGIEKLGLSEDSPRRLMFINPFASLSLLKSPNLSAVMLAGTTVLFCDYIMFVPLAETIGKRYNIDNEFLIGTCFLPTGIGSAIGAPLAGRISDYLIVKWRKQRNGLWVPEDRLRGAVVSAVTLVPLSMLSSGLTTRYVGGTLGLVINLICLFCNGLGVDLILTPIAAYCVDIMHSRSAEAFAASSGMKNFIVSLAVAGILPCVQTLGVVWTDGLGAMLAWFGGLMLWLTIRYGGKMRRLVNVEYSTLLNN